MRLQDNCVEKFYTILHIHTHGVTKSEWNYISDLAFVIDVFSHTSGIFREAFWVDKAVKPFLGSLEGHGDVVRVATNPDIFDDIFCKKIKK